MRREPLNLPGNPGGRGRVRGRGGPYGLHPRCMPHPQTLTLSMHALHTRDGRPPFLLAVTPPETFEINTVTPEHTLHYAQLTQDLGLLRKNYSFARLPRPKKLV